MSQHEDFEDDDFQCCSDCDLPDSCSDFGCAKKQGFKREDDGMQVGWDNEWF